MHDFDPKAASDISLRATRRIWLYFTLLGISLFITIIGLIIYFRFQLQYEKTKKIGEVSTQEVLNYQSHYGAILLGKEGIFPDKKFINIDSAMKIFLGQLRQ